MPHSSRVAFGVGGLFSVGRASALLAVGALATSSVVGGGQLAMADWPATTQSQAAAALQAVWAQTGDLGADEAPQAQPGLAFDATAWLTDAAVLPGNGGRLNDPVWDLTPTPGRVFVQVPFVVTTQGLTEPMPIDDPSVDIQGGRFVGWHIALKDANGARGMGGGRLGGGFDGRGVGAQPALNASAVSDAGSTDGEANEEPVLAIDGAAPLAADAPRLARELTLTPDGRVQWPMERAMAGLNVAERGMGGRFNGGSVGGSLYVLKLRPDHLRDMAPEEPGRNNGNMGRRTTTDRRSQSSTQSRSNTSRADAQARQRQRAQEAQAMAEYRQNLRDFQNLRRTVMDLPETFSADASRTVVYALFEVPEGLGRMALESDQGWSVPLNLQALANLQAVANGQGATGARLGGNGLGRGGQDFGAGPSTAEVMAEMFESGPKGAEFAARAMALGKHAANLTPNDPMLPTLNAVLSGDDADARHAVVEALAAVSPTPVTTQLLTDNQAHLSAADQLSAMRALMTWGDNPQETARQIIDAGQRFLADPQGPPVASILDHIQNLVLGDAAAQPGMDPGVDPRMGSRMDPRMSSMPGRGGRTPNARDVQVLLTAVGQGLSFDDLPSRRRSQAVAHVVSQAEQPLHGLWLGHGLLGSEDPALLQASLEALAKRPVESDGIWIDGPDHGLVALLGLSVSPNQMVQIPEAAQLAKQAWGVVDRFVVDLDAVPASAVRGGSRPATNPDWIDPRDPRAADPRMSQDPRMAQDPRLAQTPAAAPAPAAEAAQPVDNGQVLTAILAEGPKAGAQASTMAVFAARQMPNALSAQALLDWCLDPEPAWVAASAKALVGSGQPMGDALAQADPAVRQSVAGAIGDQAGEKQGPLLGLLAGNDGASRQLARWFGQVVAEGHVPLRQDWVQGAGGEGPLLQIVQNGGPTMSLAASDALVAAIGGDPVEAAMVQQSLLKAEGPVEDAWRAHKKRHFAAQLEKASGSYAVSLALYGQAGSGTRTTGGSDGINWNARMDPRADQRTGSYGGGFNDPRDPRGMVNEKLGLRAPGSRRQANGQNTPASELLVPVDGQPTSTVDLGQLQLVVSEGQVRLGTGSVPIQVDTEQLGFVLPEPSKLHTFGGGLLMDLPLDAVNQPLHLVPSDAVYGLPAGGWVGRVRLNNGQTAELRLLPDAADGDAEAVGGAGV